MSLDVSLYATRRTEVFDANITHNCGGMAQAAGIYDCLWRAPENGFTHAHQIVKLLAKGIEAMEAHPELYIELESKNGWGLYKHFLP